MQSPKTRETKQTPAASHSHSNSPSHHNLQRQRVRERDGSSSFHPEHLVETSSYTEASTHPCAACERVVTGTGYRCGDCNFNIHEACLSLPDRMTFDGHPGGHALTLTRLSASRWCDVCKETSHAGRYMYLCSPCNFDVHPRCTPLLVAAGRPPQAQQGERRRRGGISTTVIMAGLFFSLKMADGVVTGGVMSPVIDAIETALGIDIDN